MNEQRVAEVSIRGSLLQAWVPPGTAIGNGNAHVQEVVVAGDVLRQIADAEAAGARSLLVVLESHGGDAAASWAVYRALRRVSAGGCRVVCFVQGLVASAGPAIAQAADYVIMRRDGRFAIHSGHGVNLADVARWNELTARVLHERTGMPLSKLLVYTSEIEVLCSMHDLGAVRLGWADESTGRVEHDRALELARSWTRLLAQGAPIPDDTPRQRHLRGLAASPVEPREVPAGVVGHETASSDSNAPAVDPYDPEAHFHERLCSAWFPASVPQGHDLYDVAWTGARFVAVGTDGASSGRCATSDDGGGTYTARTIPVPVTAVLYDSVNATLIAVGASKCATSTNGGTTWVDRSAAIPAGTYAALATDGAGLVVAVGFNVAATSTDGGVTWTARTIPSGSYRGVAWTGPWRDGFVAVGGVAGTSVCATSTANGQTWTSRTMPAGSFIGVTRDVPGLVVSIGLTGVGARSLDGGVTWTALTTGTTEDLYDILHTGRAWIVVGRTGVTLTAIHDAVNWTKRAVAVTTVGRAIGWNGQRLVVVDQAAGAYSLEV